MIDNFVDMLERDLNTKGTVKHSEYSNSTDYSADTLEALKGKLVESTLRIIHGDALYQKLTFEFNKLAECLNSQMAEHIKLVETIAELQEKQ